MLQMKRRFIQLVDDHLAGMLSMKATVMSDKSKKEDNSSRDADPNYRAVSMMP